MNPVLEGSTLHAYGHSYLAGDFFGAAPAQRYVNRVARREGMTVNNQSVGGSYSQDTAYKTLSTWVTGCKGVALIDTATNDAIYNGSGPLAITGFERALHAIVQRMGVKQVIESNSALLTQSGGTLATDPSFSGGEVWHIPQGGAGWIQVNVSGVDEVVLGYIGLSQVAASTFEVLVDGQVVDTFTPTNAYPTSRWSVPQALVVPLPNTQSHTVKVRSTGPVVNGPWLDWVGIPAAKPIPTVIMSLLPIPYNNINDAVAEKFNDAIMRVASSRDNVFFCDARPGWDMARMVGSDSVHLTPEGQAHVAAHLETLLDTFSWNLIS